MDANSIIIDNDESVKFRAAQQDDLAFITRLEGTLRECIKTGETYESLHIMSLLRSEYR